MNCHLYSKGTRVELLVAFSDGDHKTWETVYVTVQEEMTDPKQNDWHTLLVNQNPEFNRPDIALVSVYYVEDPVAEEEKLECCMECNKTFNPTLSGLGRRCEECVVKLSNLTGGMRKLHYLFTEFVNRCEEIRLLLENKGVIRNDTVRQVFLTTGIFPLNEDLKATLNKKMPDFQEIFE